MLGILGTGQLSLMLAEAGRRLGLNALALGPGADDPASQAAEVMAGRLDDEKALAGFFARARTIVFENEFVDCDILERTGQGATFEPALLVIRELQDKIRQKKRLESLGIPSAAWFPRNEGESAQDFVARTKQRFPAGFVLKWARMGYDGKGVFISSDSGGSGGSRGSASPAAVAFVTEASRAGIPIFAEEKVAFRRELAMVFVYSTKGELANYPLVISTQAAGICRTVRGPATALGVAPKFESDACDAGAKLARGIGLHGAFALEFFETEAGELLVNEIAPRVHNSGHYTQDCSATSQFENHWRAVLGMPLGSTACSPAFAMVNLIGPPGVSLSVGPVVMEALEKSSGAGVPHWYGKREIRPGRKMGHLNGSVEDAAKLPLLVNALEERRLKWESQLK
jgi:5-(carboxyamino)imidazole ribonucleotide synthase